MPCVEVPIASVHEISSTMRASRAWLSRRRIEAYVFCSCGPGGLACSVNFRRSDEAASFAAAFKASAMVRP